MTSFIPYGRHSIDQDDMKAVEAVLKEDWLTNGPMVDAFEKAIGQAVGSPYVVACSNGTTALHLALLALELKPGDAVVVPAVTFLASANAVRFVGADVIFADVDPDTGLLTASTLEEAIIHSQTSSKIKAVINVHLNGQCENLEAIYQVAQKYNLFVIEDAAHAIGTHYVDSKGQRVPIGSNQFADVTTFSFHPAKTIATGEGGAVTCKAPALFERLNVLGKHGLLRNPEDWDNHKGQGFDESGTPNLWYYEMKEVGFNYRISDMNCALGISQFKKLKQFKETRQHMVETYDGAFMGNPISPLKKLPFSDTCWHLYVIKVDFKELGISRTHIIKELRDQGIGTQVHYMPLYRHPYYQSLCGSQHLPGAETYYATCLSIPLYVGLTDEQQNKIIKTLQDLCPANVK